jgi:serine/threonine protein kinase KIN1/2
MAYRGKPVSSVRPSSRNNSGSGSSKPVTNSRAISSSNNGSSSQQEKRKIVGQYMLGKTIGEGTFGKVKLAIHIPTGEKVGSS